MADTNEAKAQISDAECDALFRKYTAWNGSHAMTDHRAMIRAALAQQAVTAEPVAEVHVFEYCQDDKGEVAGKCWNTANVTFKPGVLDTFKPGDTFSLFAAQQAGTAPQAQPSAAGAAAVEHCDSVAMGWNTVRAEARALAPSRGIGELMAAVEQYADRRVEEALAQPAAPAAPQARPLDEWHEDDGNVVWWTWDAARGEWLGEPSYIGTPNCDDWPGYHTHWTPHPTFPAPLAALQPAHGERP